MPTGKVKAEPTRRKAASSDEPESNSSGKRKKASSSAPIDSKFNKGLRHFSMRLCKKVEEKVATTFNEVADEIVAEFAKEGAALALSGNQKLKKSHSEKNIRRRVYDALNVLMAMGVITKVKKQITWKGLPSNTRRDLDMTERQIQEKQQLIDEKRQHLEELLAQSISYHNVVEQNKRAKVAVPPEEKIPIPFIIVNTNSSTRVELEISENESDVFFNFSEPFEIHDYSEVLRRLGMHRVGANSSDAAAGGASAGNGAVAGVGAAVDLEVRKERLRGIVPEDLVQFVPDSVFESESSTPEKEQDEDGGDASGEAATDAGANKGS